MATAVEFFRWNTPRVTSSVTLLSVVVCAAGAFVLLSLTPSRPATSNPSANRLAEVTTAPEVKIIDHAAPNSPCAEQTWPYYDGRCLRRNEAASPAAAPAPPSGAPPTASSAAPPSAVDKSASLVTVPPIIEGGTSAMAPQTGPVAQRPNDAASSLPAAREPGSSGVDMDRGADRSAAREDDDAPRFDIIKPVEQPRRRSARQHHFAIFGFRF